MCFYVHVCVYLYQCMNRLTDMCRYVCIAYGVHLVWICMCPGLTTWNENLCGSFPWILPSSAAIDLLCLFLYGWNRVESHLSTLACQLVLSLLTLVLFRQHYWMDAFFLLCLGDTIYPWVSWVSASYHLSTSSSIIFPKPWV